MQAIRMPAAVKTAWVAALRSGEYKQGDGYLYNPANDSYCCLGVLCRVLGSEDGDIVHAETPDPEYMYGNGIHNIEDYIIPYDASKGKRKPTPVTSVVVREGNTSFVMMNDTFEFSFDEIADAIEQHVEGY